ncbi:cytosolic phospholipase A2 gamma-like [Clupea harengus]|uniref:Cytosolic phospholipase A2 gamma-like n=1 Tax=Clupea harengus TaxID=7950 RepID=A0A8M1KBM8_CLUHA|nr:cytosolic phospholipase A2 gamma-like [Clupea harengus]
MAVLIRHKLCDGEKQFTMERQIIVQKVLERHGIHVPDVKNISRVALLSSGGGQRANISFLGVMQQLYKEDLLNGFLYVAGVSGSTWSMSSLYQNPTWSRDAEKATGEALLSMSEGTGHNLAEKLETRPLTADRDKYGANPYPLYSTVAKQFLDKPKEMWFEFSPHESGFLQHGAYVDTSLLNKNFDGGHVKPLLKKPVDMVQLQGMCGCAMGDFAQIIQFIKDIIWNWIFSADPDHYQDFSRSLKRVDHESWRNKTDQDKNTFVENLCDELAASADKWGQGPLDVPQSNIISNDGLYLNSPYPSVLGKARDLIISFDFSDGDPFETLKGATKYAAATGHPFPKVDFTELDSNQPRSYYVFEEKGKPTVIHIPLFNMDNCKNQETIKKEREEYTTFQQPYADKAKIDHLAHLAEVNVIMNKHYILEEIKKSCAATQLPLKMPTRASAG